MSKGKRPERKIDLPPGWWLRLIDYCNKEWQHEGNEKKTRLEIYERAQTGKRTFDTAIHNNKMTERIFNRLKSAVGCGQDELLRILSQPIELTAPNEIIPAELSLMTKKSNPQWADFNLYPVPNMRPWALRCEVFTESEYFRFGFKLLSKHSQVFGDCSIQSRDPDLLVHIGRNYWDRPALGITKDDIFITSYEGARRLEENDRYLLHSPRCFTAQIEFKVDLNYIVQLYVDGKSYFHHSILPKICQRVAIFAWGDQDEYRVDVTHLSLTHF